MHVQVALDICKEKSRFDLLPITWLTVIGGLDLMSLVVPSVPMFLTHLLVISRVDHLVVFFSYPNVERLWWLGTTKTPMVAGDFWGFFCFFGGEGLGSKYLYFTCENNVRKSHRNSDNETLFPLKKNAMHSQKKIWAQSMKVKADAYSHAKNISNNTEFLAIPSCSSFLPKQQRDALRL